MRILLFLLLGALRIQAATWYVDGSVSSSGNGKSWATAWKSPSNISGVSAGDTVYFSQGTYSISGSGWTPPGGSASAPITYQTGQDTGHNGLVILDSGGGQYLIKPASNTVISGEVAGQQMMQLKGGWQGTISTTGATVSNIRIAYVKVPSHTRFAWFDNQSRVSGVEIDHCFLHKVFGNSPSALDDTFYLGGINGSGYGVIKIHDNMIESPCNPGSTAYGDDCVKWGYGIDFYANHVKIYTDPAYPPNEPYQHCDVFQNAASNVRVYNNTFQNIGESIFFHNQNGGPGNFSNILFYNNVITQSFSDNAAVVARGLDFEPQGNNADQSTFTNVQVCNNIFNVRKLFVTRFHQAKSWTNCRMSNNLYYDCAPDTSPWDAPAKAGFVIDHEAVAQANWFVAPKSDMHSAAGSPAIGAGATLDFFNTDKDGKTRNPPWDQGAYQYAGGPGPTPTPPGPTPTPPSPTPTPTPVPVAKFKAGDLVTPTAEVNVRSTPAGPVVGVHNVGDIGTVVSGPMVANLNGNPVNWYDIGWSSSPPSGWTGDDHLVLSAASPTPSPSASPTPTPSPSPSFEGWIQDQNNWIRSHPPYHDP